MKCENLDSVVLYHADCLDVLRAMPDNSVDSIVTDPPAGIAFMGKSWDSFGVRGTHPRNARRSFVRFLRRIMKECLRVLKPGGHALIWALPRTAHWTAWAVEVAGFEIRDVVVHLFGTGFNKSAYVLKPGGEHWILARKPFRGTLKANIEKWGTGLIRGNDCRIGTLKDVPASVATRGNKVYGRGVGSAAGGAAMLHTPGFNPNIGRVFANVTLDEEAAAFLDAGRVTSASRFYYVAKASRMDKTAGGRVSNNHPTVKNTALLRIFCRLITPEDGLVLDPFMGSGSTAVAAVREGLRFLGVELEREFFVVATKRARLALQAQRGADS